MNTAINLTTFLNKEQLEDIRVHQLDAYTINLIEKLFSEDEFEKFLSDFFKKYANEYLPVLRMDDSWLEQIFGFEGEILVNTSTQGVDAVYVSKDRTLIKTIELKHVACLRSGFRLNGEPKTSPYSNGYAFWNVAKKSWKFRTSAEDFHDDYALLMISNSRRNELVEVIALNKQEMKKLLTENYHSRFDKGANPIAICYRHVKEYPHMIGNKVEKDMTKEIIQTAMEENLIYQNTTKGSYFSKFELRAVGDSQVKAVTWLRSKAKEKSETGQVISSFLKKFNS